MYNTTSFSTLTALLCSLAILTFGCASEVQVTNTLPDDFKEQMNRVEAPEGVNLKFTPIPAGEKFRVSVGAMDYTLNRVFQGMLTEMFSTKFDTLNTASKNVIDVHITYLNVQEENLAGSLNRMDMGVTVQISNGFRTVERELEFSEQADIEGYGLQSGQIRNLLMRFALEINEMVNDQFSAPGNSVAN